MHRHSWRPWVALLALCLISKSAPSLAQVPEPPADNAPSAKAVAGEAGKADAARSDPVKPDADAPEPEVREQTIYIPYDKLRETFEREGRGVFLPYARFQELWNAARAAKLKAAPEQLPATALVTEIESEATVEKQVVRVRATLKIDVLAAGWSEIPLRLADAAVLSATIDDEPARLISKPDGEYRLLVKKQGKEPEQITLHLEYAKSFAKSPGQNSVSFQAPLAPVNRWRIHIPGAGAKVNIHPLLAATEVPLQAAAAAADDKDPKQDEKGDKGDKEAEPETVVLAFVGAAPTVKIDWTPKTEGAAGLEALATVQAEQEVSIDEGVTRTRTRLAYEISRAELNSLVIEVPADQKVAGVFDPNVRQWQVATEDEIQTITVQLFEPARSKQNITVELEKFFEQMDESTVAIPVVKAVGVARQQGIVVVKLGGGLRGEATKRSGLLQLDVSEMPPSLANRPWTFSYRYAAVPFELSLRVEKVQPRVEADELVEVYLEPDKLHVELFALYNIERAGIFELELTVPTGYEVRSVRGHAAAGAEAAAVDSHHLAGDDKTQLQVNLNRKALGRIGLVVQLEKRLDEANLLTPTGKSSDLAVRLPHVAADSVERATGRLVLFAPESLRVNTGTDQQFRSVALAEAMAGTESIRQGRFGDQRQVLALVYSQAPEQLSVTAERRKPHITARQLIVARFDAGVVKYQATVFYDILYSGVKALRLDLPTELAAVIHNNTPGIREQVITPEGVSKDHTAWSLTGETELIGSVAVHLNWERAIEKLDVGKSVDVKLPRIVPRDVDRAWGQIVVVKAETIDVVPAGDPQGLRPIDPQRDLMPGASVPDAARAFEFHDDWSLTLKATRYELETVKRTSIERAVLRMVVTRSRETTVQALYRMRSARQRLAVALPEGSQFDVRPLRINGRPMPLERGDKGEFYVPLVGQNPDVPFVLELRYAVTGDASQLDFPVFTDDPAAQEVHLCAYLPEELTILGYRGPWTDEQIWQAGGNAQQGPIPRKNDLQLIAELTQGIGMAEDPASSLRTGGKLYVYSTLKPEPPPVGSLRIVTIGDKWLKGLLFALVAIGGVVLIPRSAAQRLIAVGAFSALLVLSGVFFPIFSRQIFGGVLLAAVALVALLWGLVYLIYDLPGRWKAASDWFTAPRFEPATIPPVAPVPSPAPATESAAPPDASAPPPSPPTGENSGDNSGSGDGGEHHAS